MTIFSACTCEPNLAIYVTNNTNETMFVYVVYHPSDEEEVVGEVSPYSTIYKDLEKDLSALTRITVKSENESGNYFLSQEFTRQEYLNNDMQITILPAIVLPVLVP
jgi:hypothetical protein